MLPCDVSSCTGRVHPQAKQDVRDAYQSVFMREADEGGLQVYTHMLLSATMTMEKLYSVASPPLPNIPLLPAGHSPSLVLVDCLQMAVAQDIPHSPLYLPDSPPGVAPNLQRRRSKQLQRRWPQPGAPTKSALRAMHPPPPPSFQAPPAVGDRVGAVGHRGA